MNEQAFDAQEIRRIDVEDEERLMHGHLKINGTDVLLADTVPEHGSGVEGLPSA